MSAFFDDGSFRHHLFLKGGSTIRTRRGPSLYRRIRLRKWGPRLSRKNPKKSVMVTRQLTGGMRSCELPQRFSTPTHPSDDGRGAQIQLSPGTKVKKSGDHFFSAAPAPAWKVLPGNTSTRTRLQEPPDGRSLQGPH